MKGTVFTPSASRFATTLSEIVQSFSGILFYQNYVAYTVGVPWPAAEFASVRFIKGAIGLREVILRVRLLLLFVHELAILSYLGKIDLLVSIMPTI